MLSVTYLLLLLAIIVIEITRKKANLLDFLTLFNLTFALFYVFPGFQLFKIAESSGSYSLTFQSNLQILIAIYLGYFLVLIGFYSQSAIKQAKKIYVKQFSDQKLIKIARFLLIFGGISCIIYSAQYGGLSNAISQSSAIRSGNVESGSLVLFKNFFDCAEYASYLFASLIFFSPKTKNSAMLYLQFVSSIVLTLLTLLMKSSRSSIIRYLIAFILGYIIYRKKIPWLFISIGVIFSLAVIFYGDPFFSSLSSIPEGYDSFVEDFSSRLESQANESTEGSSEASFSEDFAYTLLSLDTSFNNQYQYRWFSDFIFGFTTLVPERLIPIETPKSVVYLNTYLGLGHNEWSLPPGLLALGIYSMSWTGLVTLCFSFGWVGRYLQTILTQDKNNQPWIAFLYVVIMNIWLGLISGGSPGTSIKGNAVFFLTFFFLFSVSSKTDQNSINYSH